MNAGWQKHVPKLFLRGLDKNNLGRQYTSVFRNLCKVINVGIKGFLQQENKLSSVGLGLMITDSYTTFVHAPLFGLR